MILRISPVDASASAAVSSGKDAIGTLIVVPSSDQFSNQVVGVESKAISRLLEKLHNDISTALRA
jgi:hypothetical protein